MGEEASIIVKNRDIAALQRVYGIMQDIVSAERKRAFLHDRLTFITQHISDMPKSHGGVRGLDDGIAMIDEAQERHRLLVKQYTVELRRCEKIINSIPSASMRTFVTMMYMDNIPAVEVREKLNMTRRGFDNARRAVEEAECMEMVVWREKYMVGG